MGLQVNKSGAPTDRARANQYLVAQEMFVRLLEGLQHGMTVTTYVLEPHHTDTHGEPIEFEIVVTKYGKNRLARTRTPR